MKKRATNATDRERIRLIELEPITEPEEEDLVTADHRQFFVVGSSNRRPAVTVPDGDDWRPYVRDFMEKERFFPNVWFISDHGNSHLLNWED
jgi:hypothetical protein